eukprot:scaffold8177_cov106-Cylindrotheca_fusiformis.AAC.3
MHQTGIRMTNEVIRGGEVVHQSKVDVFEFSQQGTYRVPQEAFEVSSGDSFRTSCYYRDGTPFGLSSQEEMCIAYVMYYPVKYAFGVNWVCPYGIGIPECGQTVESFDLQDESGLNRSFGTAGSNCPAPTPPPSKSNESKHPVAIELSNH